MTAGSIRRLEAHRDRTPGGSQPGMDEIVYQLKVTLLESEPPIWRRLLVSGRTSLKRLHEVLQVAIGWTNSHLYEFRVGEARYGDPVTDEFEEGIKDASRARLSSVLKARGDSLLYMYDFGDDWQHEVLLENILGLDKRRGSSPVCLEGERACPPEDCGGIESYSELLEAIKDPQHPEHDRWLTWLDGGFDAEYFDVREVNRMLGLLVSFVVAGPLKAEQ